MRSKKENKNKENTEISLNPQMGHTCNALGQTETEQSAETDTLTMLQMVAIGFLRCAHRHRVSSSRPHNNNTCKPRDHKKSNKKKNKQLQLQLQLQHANSQEEVAEKCCRELHSLQVDDSIATLYPSTWRQQLTSNIRDTAALQPQQLARTRFSSVAFGFAAMRWSMSAWSDTGPAAHSGGAGQRDCAGSTNCRRATSDTSQRAAGSEDGAGAPTVPAEQARAQVQEGDCCKQLCKEGNRHLRQQLLSFPCSQQRSRRRVCKSV